MLYFSRSRVINSAFAGCYFVIFSQNRLYKMKNFTKRLLVGNYCFTFAEERLDAIELRGQKNGNLCNLSSFIVLSLEFG